METSCIFVVYDATLSTFTFFLLLATIQISLAISSCHSCNLKSWQHWCQQVRAIDTTIDGRAKYCDFASIVLGFQIYLRILKPIYLIIGLSF